MKKIMVFTTTMVFVLALGSAFAGNKSDNERFNGITDFKGGSYDTFEIKPAGAPVLGGFVVESSSAGGLREGTSVKELYNGITDFSGRSYDTFELAPIEAKVTANASIESSSAGGLRTVKSISDLYNGVTDFSGRSYDTFELEPAK